MLELHEVSRIGFGTYRISDKEHEQALYAALKSGCNLIDTASNYGDGASENLVGSILQSLPDQETFVVSKAGYISGANLRVLEEVHSHGKAREDLVDLSATFKHSIHPDYLAAQMNVSLQRLRRSSIDGFLLHSPEYYFDQKSGPVTSAGYYERIARAFEFLEQKVQDGAIRYYGVSSNTMGLTDSGNTTNLTELLRIAGNVSSANHFKLIQFPFNLIERSAADGHPTLIGIAKQAGLTTFGNRPLNANLPTGALRLVLHDLSNYPFDTTADDALHATCFSVIETQLEKKSPGSTLAEFPMLAFLKQNWKTLPHLEAFEGMFYRSFYPFVNLLFDQNIPADALKVFKSFQSTAYKYYLLTSSCRVRDYLVSTGMDRLLSGASGSLVINAVREYLELGIDHVLIGMRKPGYVRELGDLLQMRQADHSGSVIHEQ